MSSKYCRHHEFKYDHQMFRLRFYKAESSIPYRWKNILIWPLLAGFEEFSWNLFLGQFQRINSILNNARKDLTFTGQGLGLFPIKFNKGHSLPKAKLQQQTFKYFLPDGFLTKFYYNF